MIRDYSETYKHLKAEKFIDFYLKQYPLLKKRMMTFLILPAIFLLIDIYNLICLPSGEIIRNQYDFFFFLKVVFSLVGVILIVLDHWLGVVIYGFISLLMVVIAVIRTYYINNIVFYIICGEQKTFLRAVIELSCAALILIHLLEIRNLNKFYELAKKEAMDHCQGYKRTRAYKPDENAVMQAELDQLLSPSEDNKKEDKIQWL